MYPVEPSGLPSRRGMKHPYLILPVEHPAVPLPAGTIYVEALLFSLRPYPPAKILRDYCKIKKQDAGKFVCHAVVFQNDFKRDGRGRLSIHKDGDGYRMEVEWLDEGKDGH